MTVMTERRAKDSLGAFYLNAFGVCRCGVCGKRNTISVTYKDRPMVSAYVAKAPSLLIRNKKTKNFIRTIGINCGCYAKIHRQIAHIEGGKK